MIYLLTLFNVEKCWSRVTMMQHFWTQNGSFTPKKNFFRKKRVIFFSLLWPLLQDLNDASFLKKKTINIKFMYLLAPFTVQNLNKILEADSELWGYIIYWPKWPIGLNRNFHRKSNNIFFIYVLFFFMQNIWRESLQRISRKLTFVKFHQPIMLN